MSAFAAGYRKYSVINNCTRAPRDKGWMLGRQHCRKWPLLKHLISPTLKPTAVHGGHKALIFKDQILAVDCD